MDNQDPIYLFKRNAHPVSIKYFLETGKVSGSLYIALKEIATLREEEKAHLDNRIAALEKSAAAALDEMYKRENEKLQGDAGKISYLNQGNDATMTYADSTDVILEGDWARVIKPAGIFREGEICQVAGIQVRDGLVFAIVKGWGKISAMMAGSLEKVEGDDRPIPYLDHQNGGTLYVIPPYHRDKFSPGVERIDKY